MTNRAHALLAAALLASFVPRGALGAGAAGDLHPLDAIERRAADLLRGLHAGATGAGAKAEVEVRSLDRRLRLKRCDGTLDAALVAAGPDRPAWGANVVEVSCPGAPGWRVRVRTHTTIEREVWTLASAVRRGDPLTRDLLVRETVTLGATGPGARRVRPGAAASLPPDALDPLLGQQFTRSLRAGSVPTGADLAPPVLVQRGRRVRLRREGAGLSVETYAVALDDARRDERVSVRNARTGRRLDAVVIGADEVSVR